VSSRLFFVFLQISDCQIDKILWGNFIPDPNEKKIPLTTKHDIMSYFFPVALVISIFYTGISYFETGNPPS